MHGNLSQSARERNLAAFAEGGVNVLVATDVAARGVHVDAVELVVHVDPPTEHKAYLHRSGRTARAGSTGDVVTIMTPEERKDTQALLRKAKISVKPQKVTADSAQVSPLVGEVAPFVEPQEANPEKVRGTEPAQAASQKRSSRRRRGRRGAGARTGAQSGEQVNENGSGSRSGGSQASRGQNGAKGQGRTSGRTRSRSRADQSRGRSPPPGRRTRPGRAGTRTPAGRPRRRAAATAHAPEAPSRSTRRAAELVRRRVTGSDDRRPSAPSLRTSARRR